MPFLATTASITPFIGLFGTVWGIMSAFQQHRRSRARRACSVVAPGIAEALIATAAGLFAAIPAVLLLQPPHEPREAVRVGDGRLLAGVPEHLGAELHLDADAEVSRHDAEVQQIGAPGGRRGRGARVSTSLAEINVVPLVDVMLVLLIIFMVTAPMMQRGCR